MKSQLPGSKVAAGGKLRLLAFLLTLGAISLFAVSVHAETVSGKYQASALKVAWAIGDWGEACGPRPSGGGTPGGAVELSFSQGEFSWNGLGRSYHSRQCFEVLPGLRPVGHQSSPSAIQTTCKMPPSDPRMATVVTSWMLRDDTIYFNETGQYQFVTQGSNCTASVRRTRTLTRAPEPAQKAKDAPPASTLAPRELASPAQLEVASPPPGAPRASHCEKPGAPVSLELSPQVKLIRAGETFTFSAVLRDAKGCRLRETPEFSLLEGQTLGSLTRNGALTVLKEASSGWLRIQAKSGAHTVEAKARVVSEAEFDDLLGSGGFDETGESHAVAKASVSSQTLSVAAASKGRKGAHLAWLIGGLLVLGLLVTWFILQRSRKPASIPSASDAPLSNRPETMEEPNAEETRAPESRICPLCGTTYQDGSGFCGNDGARLVRTNDGALRK